MCKTSQDRTNETMLLQPELPAPRDPTRSEIATSVGCSPLAEAPSTLQWRDFPLPGKGNSWMADEPSRVDEIRQVMRKLLRRHLVVAKGKAAKKAAEHRPSMKDVQKVDALVRRLEVVLFEKASSLPEYAELDTLEGRVNLLLTKMVGRCIQRAAQQEDQEREDAFRLILGRERLSKVKELVREIKRLQLAPPLQVTPGVAPFFAPLSVPSSMMALRRHRLTAQDKPVRDLFTKTPLVQAFELTPTEGLNTVPWDELTHQSQQVTDSYKAWMKRGPDGDVLLTDSNIRALEQKLATTTEDIIDTFKMT